MSGMDGIRGLSPNAQKAIADGVLTAQEAGNLTPKEKAELAKILHPKAVYNIKIGKYSVSKDILYQTLMFVSFYLAILVISGFIIAILEHNTTVGISSAVSALGNIGPGLGKIIGPLGHFSDLHDFSKIIIIFDMYIGRLELIPFLVLFQKELWVLHK